MAKDKKVIHIRVSDRQFEALNEIAVLWETDVSGVVRVGIDDIIFGVGRIIGQGSLLKKIEEVKKNKKEI